MTLDTFIKDEYKIDLDALARIRKRVMIVGRFNQASMDGEPDVYLFTNRGDLSDAYLKNFRQRFSISYDNFVQALTPAIAEQVNTDGKFPRVKQVIPTGSGDAEATSTIDPFNYFFQRAVSNSSQPEFTSGRDDQQLLKSGEKDRGKDIMKQVRRNMEKFCAFQPQTHRILQSMAEVMQECVGFYNLPEDYAEGAPFPAGFAEKLIDFLYDENTSESFRKQLEEGVEFCEPWRRLEKDRGAREMFVNIVDAFRDRLVHGQADSYSGIQFGASSLRELTELVPQDLIDAFCDAREAYNSLRQVLRSKVLLSMVLEWLLNAFYDLPTVKEQPTAAKKNRAASDAILTDWARNGLAEPVKRPSMAEREKFSDLLVDHFDKMLRAIIAEDDAVDAIVAELPDELRKITKDIRGNAEQAKVIRGVSGAAQGKEMTKAFTDACKTILIDVMCPVLYRSPVLTTQDLKRYFRQETMAAYLTAIFLSDQNQDAVKNIAEDHLDYFESKIDDATQEIRDVNEIHGVLLTDFMKVLADPRIERQLSEGIRVLTEVQAMLDVSGGGQAQGAGKISAMRPETGQDPLEETESGREIVRVVIEKRAERALARAQRAAETESSGGVATAGDDHAQAEADAAEAGAEPAGNPTATAVAPETAAGGNGDDEVQSQRMRQIDDILGRMTLPEVPTNATEEDRHKLAAKVAQQFIQQEKQFVGGLATDIQAFEKTLHLIYHRYTQNPDKKTFRNKVERMTLVNMMLLWQKDLGLGKMLSNLYRLLLDLILETDPEKPDAMTFLKRRSLTEYFDGEQLKGGGFGALVRILEVQAVDSLQNVVNFVSELRGVKYLMDKIPGSDTQSQVIVVNATADEFCAWLQTDNFEQAPHVKGRMRCGRLLADTADAVIHPGVVYMTDIAFGELPNAKQAWLGSLAEQCPLQNPAGSASMLLPPIVMSLGPQDAAAKWESEGKELARLANDAPAGVVIVGPSPRLNDEGDGFPTVLPAGYLVATYLLTGPAIGLRIPNQLTRSSGRFRAIGYGASMEESLKGVVWGEGPNENYCFAADNYLYIILTLMGAAHRSGKQPAEPLAGALYPCFYYGTDPDQLPDRRMYESSVAIDPAVIGGQAMRMALDQDVSSEGVRLEAVLVGRKSDSIVNRSADEVYKVDQVNWFNVARQSAALP